VCEVEGESQGLGRSARLKDSRNGEGGAGLCAEEVIKQKNRSSKEKDVGSVDVVNRKVQRIGVDRRPARPLPGWTFELHVGKRMPPPMAASARHRERWGFSHCTAEKVATCGQDVAGIVVSCAVGAASSSQPLSSLFVPCGSSPMEGTSSLRIASSLLQQLGSQEHQDSEYLRRVGGDVIVHRLPLGQCGYPFKTRPLAAVALVKLNRRCRLKSAQSSDVTVDDFLQIEGLPKGKQPQQLRITRLETHFVIKRGPSRHHL
jgi:hypothetical protein